MITPEKIVFILSTGRTGTKTLAEGLVGDNILSPHQPPHSRFLTIASNYYLHGWLAKPVLEGLVRHLREPQILQAKCQFYIQAFSLDYFPAKIISQKYPNVYVVHIIRDPRTFVPSYLNWMHTRFKSFVANKLVPGWQPSGLFTGEISWKRWLKMNEFERVCWQWVYKNRLLQQLFQDDERYMQVRFEDLLLSQTPDMFRSMLSFVGIPYQDRFDQMLCRPKNSSRKTYFPKWEDWIPERQQQLLDICGEQMQYYGYG